MGHGGFSRGYGSMIQMVPARKVAVIVLTNKSGETMRKSLNKAMEIGLGLKDDEEKEEWEDRVSVYRTLRREEDQVTGLILSFTSSDSHRRSPGLSRRRNPASHKTGLFQSSKNRSPPQSPPQSLFALPFSFVGYLLTVL